MKTITQLFIIGLFFIGFSAHSATITVTGKVTNGTAGKSGVTVIYTDSASNYSDTAITNSTGNYTIVLQTGSASQGQIHGYIVNCISRQEYQHFFYNPSGTTYSNKDFNWCNSGSGNYTWTISGNVSNRGTTGITVMADSLGGVFPNATSTVNMSTGNYTLTFSGYQPGWSTLKIWIYIIDCKNDTIVKTLNLRGTYLNYSNINFNYCNTTPPPASYSTVAGTVFKGSATAGSATVLLISHDSGYLKAVDTALTQGGRYSFTIKDSTLKYYVKGFLNSTDSDYGMYIPTYSSSSPFWGMANSIPPAYNTTFSRDINLVPGIPVPGPAFIGGFVWNGANKRSGSGDPRANTQVMLLQNGKVVVSTMSKADGSFSFTNIAYGTYTVHAEVTGIPTQTLDVTVSEDETKIENVDVSVNKSGVTTTRETTDPSSVSIQSMNERISVYPNPFTNSLRVDFVGDVSNATITLTDINGKVVLNAVNANTSNFLNTSDLDNGVYILNVTSGSQTEAIKIIK